MIIRTRKPSDVRSSEITPEDIYVNRRRFIRNAALGVAAVGFAPRALRAIDRGPRQQIGTLEAAGHGGRALHDIDIDFAMARAELGFSQGQEQFAVTQIIFAFNFLWSLRKGKVAGNNPWRSSTLLWTTPSPPPHGNFPEMPIVYRGPYEYSHPDREEDFWPQDEPPATSEAGGQTATAPTPELVPGD